MPIPSFIILRYLRLRFAFHLHLPQLFLAVVIALVFAPLVRAQETAAPRHTFDLITDEAEPALKRFSEQSGRQVLFPTDLVRGVKTNAVRGEFTAFEALTRMLDGTPLAAAADTRTGAFAITRQNSAAGSAQPGAPRAPERRSAATGAAAGAPTGSGSGTGQDGVIELSPFTVSVEADRGYAATNTLSGNRLNTPLRDTAASINVFTSEFIADLAATDLEGVMNYGLNAQLQQHDNVNFGTAAPNGNNIVGVFKGFRVRGQPTTRARNYFEWEVPTDNFNVDRIEQSRGPNSVLFGIGSAGGVINTTTKQAQLRLPLRDVAITVGSYDEYRGTLDINQPIVRDKFAVRLNTVWEKKNSFFEHGGNEDRRAHLAAKYIVTPKTTVRAEVEVGDQAMVNYRSWTTDAITGWLAAGSPTFATAPPAAQRLPNGVNVRNNVARVTYIENSGEILNLAGEIITRPMNMPILDPNLAAPSVTAGGPAQGHDVDYVALSAFFEQRFGQETFLELGYNHQGFDRTVWNAIQAENVGLQGDPNGFVPGTGGRTANEFEGQMFIDTGNGWTRNVSGTTFDNFRGTITSRFDAGKWGDYRVAALGEYQERFEKGQAFREVWGGAPFHPDPLNAANFIQRRNYVTPGAWETYRVSGAMENDFVTGAYIDPATGATRTLTSRWIGSGPDIQRDPSNTRTVLLGAHARYFDERLVLGVGLRRDNQRTVDHGAFRDPVTQEWQFDPDRRNATYSDFTGNTRSLGVAAHVTKNISLYYNQANNTSIPSNDLWVFANPENDVRPRGVLADAPEGEGEDVGLALDLLGGKVHFRATYYTSNVVGVVERFGGDDAPWRVSEVILNDLRDTGQITQAVYDEHHSDQASGVNANLLDEERDGYEFTFTANPTNTWRMTANFSIANGSNSNVAPDVEAWWNREREFFERANVQSSPTVDGQIAMFQEALDSRTELDGVTAPGLRRYSFNYFTRYTFRESFLRGAYIGGGYRYQSKMAAGRDSVSGRVFEAPSFWRADLLLGYTLPKRENWPEIQLQLNVANLFDDDDYLVLRYDDSGTISRIRHQVPRTTRFTVTVGF